MRTLSPNDAVAFLPPDPATLDAGLFRFESSLASMLYQKPGAFKRMVNEGWTVPEVINVKGVPSYLLSYHMTPDGGLWIDMLQSIQPDPIKDALRDAVVPGLELLARQKRAPYIRFFTKRSGLTRLAADSGFVPEGVMMTKGVA